MVFDPASLAGHGLNFVSGMLNRSAQADANQQRMFHAQQQMQQQEEFAKKGIRWKVADAQAAGIHPLFALGASTSGYAPVSVGIEAETGIGDALGRMGQDVSRAVNATRTSGERDKAFSDAVKSLQLKNLGLDTDIKQAALASAIQKLRQNENPALPGQGAPVELTEDKQGKATPLVAFNRQIRPARGWSDGQTYEDRWGELGGSIAGLGVMAADLAKYGRDWVLRNQGSFPNMWRNWR